MFVPIGLEDKSVLLLAFSQLALRLAFPVASAF
jgi:hypothetical protein